MVYSASYDVSFYVDEARQPEFMFRRQAIFLGVGLLVMTVMAFFDYHLWRRLALPGMVATIVGLVGVLIVGRGDSEFARNLSGGSVQPSELAKLMIVIYLAVWLFAKREYLSDVSLGLLPLGAILGIVSGFIFMQPDLSAALTVILLGGIMFYLAGGEIRQILILIVLTILIGLIVVRVHPTGIDRLESFREGLNDPYALDPHVQKAMAAFANGGWIGVGIGQGTLKLGILPVPHTDSIFAVIGEEFGLLGSTVVVALFGLFLWRGLVIARRAPDGLGSLLAAGISVWITMEAFMNMMALTGLMPFSGNPLPFFSVGGSNLVSTLLGVGIVLNISRLSEQKQLEEERRTLSALINLRGRDWRRRVSRPRRARTTKR
jgi:cell division protein FtsW